MASHAEPAETTPDYSDRKRYPLISKGMGQAAISELRRIHRDWYMNHDHDREHLANARIQTRAIYGQLVEAGLFETAREVSAVLTEEGTILPESSAEEVLDQLYAGCVDLGYRGPKEFEAMKQFMDTNEREVDNDARLLIGLHAAGMMLRNAAASQDAV